MLHWLANQLEGSKTFISAPHGQMTCFVTCATDTTMAQSMIDQTFDAVLANQLDAQGIVG